MFDQILNIGINSPNQDTNVFLTFDMDWASDEVIEYTHNIVQEYNVPSTWFITHSSKYLNKLLEDRNVNVGIHPNFNDLLGGYTANSLSIRERIMHLLEITDGSKMVRSHSMTQNSRILDTFFELGITHDCNHYIPHTADVHLRAWKIWNGLIKVPYFWEDDLNILESSPEMSVELANKKTLKVFDFHPIHILLNTKDVTKYQAAKAFQSDFNKLVELRFQGYGTENFLRDLIVGHELEWRDR